MQQLFRLINFLNQPYLFRATNSPILRCTFWLYTQLLVQCADTATDRCHRGTGRQQCRCIVPKAVYTVKKFSWGWANLSPETCRADLKWLINEKVVASCWLLTSLKNTSLECFSVHSRRSVGVNVLMSVFETCNGQAEVQTLGSQENAEGLGKLLINAGTETFPVT